MASNRKMFLHHQQQFIVQQQQRKIKRIYVYIVPDNLNFYPTMKIIGDWIRPNCSI